MTQYDYIILGGGSAGCTLAGRLSEKPENKVLMIEAGKDFAPGQEPADILSSYPMAAAFNTAYHWTELNVRHTDRGNSPDRAPLRYMEQARVVGGGSSINAQMANRGSPEDYAEWAELGADGWGWEDVLPFFRKLESDEDFDGELHGKDGPIIVRREKEDRWTNFSHAVSKALTNYGLPALEDQNGEFKDGWFPPAISNHPEDYRRSAAMGYLNADVRKRPNLEIRSETQVEKILFEGTKAIGAQVRRGGKSETINGTEIIVSAGALHTPALLMRSGVGRAGHLREHGIEMVADRPGIGANLNEHPTLAVSAYLTRDARQYEMGRRHAHVAFRYSSGIEGCGAQDMYVSATAKSAWHAVGLRLGSFLLWCNKPYSRGTVGLISADPMAEPDVDFAMLSDSRDLERMKDAVRRMAELFTDPALTAVARDPFPSCYSEAVRRIGKVSTKNKILTSILGAIMDCPSPVRRAAVHYFITEGVTLKNCLNDDAAMDAYVRDGTTGCWHPSGTCRMGRADDPMAVTDPTGRVYGVNNLRVCDASIFPCVPRANTNIPTIMCAEKIADAIKAG
jgi:5-(hydroxymethyl)furfural/furfural oxidase